MIFGNHLNIALFYLILLHSKMKGEFEQYIWSHTVWKSLNFNLIIHTFFVSLFANFFHSSRIPIPINLVNSHFPVLIKNNPMWSMLAGSAYMLIWLKLWSSPDISNFHEKNKRGKFQLTSTRTFPARCSIHDVFNICSSATLRNTARESKQAILFGFGSKWHGNVQEEENVCGEKIWEWHQRRSILCISSF